MLAGCTVSVELLKEKAVIGNVQMNGCVCVQPYLWILKFEFHSFNFFFLTIQKCENHS